MTRFKFKNLVLALSLGALTGALGSAAQAQTRDDPPARSFIPFTSFGYVGANVGQSDFSRDCFPGFGCDQKDVGFKIYTGGQLWKILGLELAYINMGKAEVNGGPLRAQGANLSLVANLPIGSVFSVFGKFGGTYGWTQEEPSSLAVGSRRGSERGFNRSFGGGLSFDVSSNLQILAEWERHRFAFISGDRDIDLISGGVRYKF